MTNFLSPFEKESYSFSITDGEDQEHHYSFFVKDFRTLETTIQLDGRIMLVLPDEWEEFGFSLFCFPNYVGNSLFTLRMDTFDNFMNIDVRLTLMNEDNTVIPFESKSYMQSSQRNSLEYTEYGDREQIMKALKGNNLKVNAYIFMNLSCSEEIDVYYPRHSNEEQIKMMMKTYQDAYNDQNISDLKFIIYDIKTKMKETVFLNKTMLVARSPYFDEILSHNENASVLVEQQFETEIVTTVLAYLYGHPIEDLEEDVFKYLRIAFKYELNYLLNRIDDFLCTHMPKNDDELIFLELATKYNLQKLRRSIIQRYVEEKTDFDEFGKWQMLVTENPELEEELMRVLIIEEDERLAQMETNESNENEK